MTTFNSIDDETRNDHITSHIIPPIALYSLSAPTAQEAVGSVSEGSGPTTGQISPRF